MKFVAPEVMTLSDLRKYLRTNHYRVKKLLEEGTIPGNQVNERGDWRVLKVDVDDWLRNKRKQV
ncbi:MAG TPA: hypothetical protein DDZ91_07160 [Firmicutes bacterium]|jgi:hypothetical protein|nr:hypothetical protein [Bacillota bacterium]